MPVHENSLANLAPSFTKDNAKEMQRRSAAARKANNEARAQLKMSMKEWKLYKEAVMEENDVSSVDVLRILMFKALEEERYDDAQELAKNLAEYDAPKLARIESTVENITTEDLSDEELEARLQAALKKAD